MQKKVNSREKVVEMQYKQRKTQHTNNRVPEEVKGISRTELFIKP